MPSVEKIIRRMCRDNLPADWDVEDVVKVLEYLGYKERPKGATSHRVFVNVNAPPNLKVYSLPTVSGRKVKVGYIRQIRDNFDLCEKIDEERTQND